MTKRMYLLLGVIIAALFGGAIWYLGEKGQSSYVVIAPPSNLSDSVDVSRPPTEYPLVVTQRIQRNDATARYTIDAEYPSIVLATDPRTAQLASDIFKGEVGRMIDEFVQNAQESASPENVPLESSSELTIRYQPVLLTPSLISVRFDRSMFFRGAARPNADVRVVQYSTVDHALLSTSDLFVPGSDYLGFLSDYTRSRLMDRFTDLPRNALEEAVVPGTEPKPENFRDVLVTPMGLTVYWSPGIVAPYARGIVTVDIPQADISARLSSIVRNAIQEANASSTSPSEPSIQMMEDGN